MRRYTVEFNFEADGWVHGCATFRGNITAASHRKIERVLDETFEQTQRDVHIITGSLKASGKKFIIEWPNGELSWGIEYGGSSGGAPNDPVDYAEYEMMRGGSHDFLTPALVRHEKEFRERLMESFSEVVGLWR